jgi:hypothetical protein
MSHSPLSVSAASAAAGRPFGTTNHRSATQGSGSSASINATRSMSCNDGPAMTFRADDHDVHALVRDHRGAVGRRRGGGRRDEGGWRSGRGCGGVVGRRTGPADDDRCHHERSHDGDGDDPPTLGLTVRARVDLIGVRPVDLDVDLPVVRTALQCGWRAGRRVAVVGLRSWFFGMLNTGPADDPDEMVLLETTSLAEGPFKTAVLERAGIRAAWREEVSPFTRSRTDAAIFVRRADLERAQETLYR